jgi:D-amino-acid dehydrogenase
VTRGAIAAIGVDYDNVGWQTGNIVVRVLLIRVRCLLRPQPWTVWPHFVTVGGGAAGEGAVRVAVLGAGIVGLTTAYQLVRRGHEVSIVDRQPGPALECSHANGGYIAISQAVPWSAPGVPTKTLLSMLQSDAPILLHAGQLPRMWRWGLEFLRASRAEVSWRNTQALLRLALHSLEQLKRVRADAAIDYSPVLGGSLKLYSDAQTMAEALAESERQRPFGLNFHLLDRQQIVARVPALAPRIEQLTGAIHYPDEEGGDCFAFARGLADWCGRRGATLLFNRRVVGLETSGDSIAAIRTDQDRITADVYVLAAGGETPRLMRPLGCRLPIIPVKGYSLTLPRSAWPEAPMTPVLDERRKFGYAPLGADRLRLSGLAEIAGYDTTPQPRRTAAFVRTFTELFPQLADVMAKQPPQPFCCLRPVTPSGLPILGPGRFRNLHYNVGHGHLGWTLAHGTAALVADLIDGAPAALDPSPYRPGRDM